MAGGKREKCNCNDMVTTVMTHFSLRTSPPLRDDSEADASNWIDDPIQPVSGRAFMPEVAASGRGGHVGQQDDWGDVDWDVRPGDRLGPPPRRRRLRRLIRWAAVLAVIGGTGWSYLDDGPLWGGVSWAVQELGGVATRVHVAATSQQAPPPAQASSPVADPRGLDPVQSARQDAVVDTTQPSPPPHKPAAQPVAEPVATEPAPAAEPAPSTAEDGAGSAAASVPYAAPPADAASTTLAPHQKRAVAVGLHPALSRVLLETLTETDLRNAGTAVRTALARSSDDAVVRWPEAAKRGLANFQVHFVPGATDGCRRFVVVIAKGGWETTALPMESCGGTFVPARD